MKTYCWKCEKRTVIKNPKESERSEKLIRGACESCGITTYKTITGTLKITN